MIVQMQKCVSTGFCRICVSVHHEGLNRDAIEDCCNVLSDQVCDQVLLLDDVDLLVHSGGLEG
jgi:hypothetical protein